MKNLKKTAVLLGAALLASGCTDSGPFMLMKIEANPNPNPTE